MILKFQDRLYVKTVDIQIHVFADASENAYRGWVYIRVKNKNDQIFVSLLAGKSMVASSNIATIPRLEMFRPKCWWIKWQMLH